jgi:hypothetical protein
MAMGLMHQLGTSDRREEGEFIQKASFRAVN